MRMHNRTTIIIGIALIGLLLVLLAGAKLILLDSFVKVEEDCAWQDLQRVVSAINDDLDHLGDLAGDYAGTAAAGRFLASGDAGLIKPYLDSDTFIKSNLNLVAYLRSSGEVVYAKAFDLQRGRDIPVPAEFARHTYSGSLLMRHSSVDGVVKGLLLVSDQLMLVVSRPILSDRHQGQILGALIMGRNLSAAEVAKIARTTRLFLQIITRDDPALKTRYFDIPAPLSANEPVYLDTSDYDRLVGHLLLRDIYAKPVAAARVVLPRQIYHQGIQAVIYFVICVLIMAVVIFAVSHRLISKLHRSQRQKEESEHLYTTVVENAAEGVVLVQAENCRILQANKAFCRLLGYAEEELSNMPFWNLLTADRRLFELQMERLPHEEQLPWMEIHILRKDGSEAFMELCANSTRLEGEQLFCFLLHDITERKRFEAELMHQANYDYLTGLPNRILLNDRLEQALALGNRTNLPQAVLLLDLDNFKYINDTLGHIAGDALLQQVAERLNVMTRKYNTVARLGGDEFVILLSNLPTDEVVIVAERILGLFETPFPVQGKEVFVTVSIGISMSPTDGDTVEKLIKNADIAMYLVKEHGRNNFMFFAEEMNRLVRERMELELQLRRALERNEFVLHYQPRVTVDGQVVGMEALLRWQPPDGPLVGPDRFIGLLEDTGLIVPVGEWVVREACRQTRIWQVEGLSSLRVSINLSGRQFRQPGLDEMIGRVLKETRFPGELLEVEITESTLMGDAAEAVEKLACIKEMGVRIAVDDFGTGYSSLAYLKRFPIDTLKIDRSFVAGVASDPGDAVIARTIIAMAHNLKMEVVAEGVETAEQLAFMRAHGCEEVQGYYFCHPLPPKEFAETVNGGILALQESAPSDDLTGD